MNQDRSHIRRLMIAVNAIDGIYALTAKKIGLKENTLSLFYALDDGKAHTQKQICEEWLIPKTTINTIVKECMEKGYVTLISGEGSHEKLISLTPKGRHYAKTVLTHVYAIEDQAMEKTLEQFPVGFIDAAADFSAQLSNQFKQYFMEKENNEEFHKN